MTTRNYDHSTITTTFCQFHVFSKDSDKMAYANSVDPDQTAPEGAVWSGSKLFAIPRKNFRNNCIKANVWGKKKYEI